MLRIFLLFISAVQAANIPRSAYINLGSNLDAGIRTACACVIDGVSVTSWDTYPDVSQWRIDWQAGTTDAQKQAGQTFMTTFDPANPDNQKTPKTP